jgi:hypothetical protein
MHKNTMKCNETLSKWCKNKHRVSKIIDTFETYQQDRTPPALGTNLEEFTYAKPSGQPMAPVKLAAG